MTSHSCQDYLDELEPNKGDKYRCICGCVYVYARHRLFFHKWKFSHKERCGNCREGKDAAAAKRASMDLTRALAEKEATNDRYS